MALYSDFASAAAMQLNALGQQVHADMAAGEGVAWWDHLDTARSILIGDYLIGLTESAAGNLTQASMHLERARALWDVDGIAMIGRMRTAAARGQGVMAPPTAADMNRKFEADGHVAGFFRAAGSVLDNVGGIVVGAAGLATSIVRADWSTLKVGESLPKGPSSQGPGRDLQVAVVDAARSALSSSPAGWSEWTLDLRNTLVHRASRLTMIVADKRQPSGFLRPLPRHPAQTQAESLARTDRLGGDVVPEHATDTMKTVLEALTDVVSVTASACVEAWDARRASPEMVRQPRAQWPRLQQGRESSFGGGNPIRLPLVKGYLAVNPTTADRFRATRAMDGEEHFWRQAFAADELSEGD